MGNWTASAWPILASAALKSTLVLGAAWLIAYLLRGRSAAARHMVWTASAAALVALPLLSVALPALRVRMANAVLPADSGIVFRAAATTAAEGDGAVTGKAAPAGRSIATPAPERGIDGKFALMLLWMAGIAAGLLQMLGASAMLWRTRRAARISPDQGEADALARSLGIEHPVRVLETPAGMPMTFGVLRPTVLLPEEARAWSGGRRRVVLLHELAHVLRGDAVTHLLARTALVLHWWNPLAWTAWREFVKERERATDDLVLGAGTTASDYAGHLLEIARTMQVPAGAAAGIGAKAIRQARINAIGSREVAVSPVFRVGGGVKAPSLLYKAEPEYSEEARAAKYQGTVLLKVVVDVDGQAKDIQVLNGLGLGLDEQAVMAIQRWKFKPGERDGEPVAVQAQIEVNFRLK